MAPQGSPGRLHLVSGGLKQTPGHSPPSGKGEGGMEAELSASTSPSSASAVGISPGTYHQLSPTIQVAALLL